MRIIAGEFRHRTILAPPPDPRTGSHPARPIPDRVKESLFSILRGHCEDAAVFDGFAGSGAIGLEALSRGAASCVFVERDRRCADTLRRNIALLGVEDRAEVVVGDALGAGALARCPRPADLVFLDPPYGLVRDPVGFRRVLGQLEQLVARLAPDGFAVLRTPWPLRHATTEDGSPWSPARDADAPGPSPRRPDRREREVRGRWRPDMPERRRRPAPDDHDGDSDAPASPEADERGRKLTWHDASLAVAGANGPESHVYRHTAVHLYMRRG